jgi:hypothetical protein
MPITAIELHDRDFAGRDCYPKVRVALEGTYATRYFRVNTHEYDLALTAMNLPGTFDPLAMDPLSVVMEISAEKVGGEVYVVTVEYMPVQPGIRDPDDTADDTLKFTSFVVSTDQATIELDAVNMTDPIPETTIEANKIELVVVVYKSSVLGVASAWNAIANKLNANVVTFPPYRFTIQSEVAPVKSLLARTISHDPIKPGLHKFTMTFGYAPPGSWRKIWYDRDEDGVPILGHINDLYPAVTYPAPGGALW